MRKLLSLTILAGSVIITSCNQNPEPSSSYIETTVAPADETEDFAESDTTANGNSGSASVEASDSTK